MPARDVWQNLSEDQRREIFRILITGQDLDMSLAESRQMVMEMYRLNEAQVLKIEQEGMDAGWPPL
jgi:hypothetical protein